MVADLLAGRRDPSGFRSRRGPGRLRLGLARRQDRPAHRVPVVGGDDLAGDRRHGVHARTGRHHPGLAVPDVLPVLCRHRQRRYFHDRPAAGSGIHPRLQARLGQRPNHDIAAGRRHAGRPGVLMAAASDRLALPLPGRAVTARPGVHDPLLGPGIAALADADGPHGRGPQVACLGADARSQSARPPRDGCGCRDDALARTVQVSAAARGRVSDRADPDRRRLAWSVGCDAARHRTQHNAGARCGSDGMGRPFRDRRPVFRYRPDRAAGAPRRRNPGLRNGRAADGDARIFLRHLSRPVVAVLHVVRGPNLFQQRDLHGRRTLYVGDLAGSAAQQRHGRELWRRQYRRQGFGTGGPGAHHGRRRHHQAGGAEPCHARASLCLFRVLVPSRRRWILGVWPRNQGPHLRGDGPRPRRPGGGFVTGESASRVAPAAPRSSRDRPGLAPGRFFSAGRLPYPCGGLTNSRWLPYTYRPIGSGPTRLQQRTAEENDSQPGRANAPGTCGRNGMFERLEQQKKLTANQWKLICTANVADVLDFFDFFLIGYVTAALTKEWSLPYWQGGAILLASGLGAVPGAFVWGWLGDKIGRRTVFIWSAITISLATGIMVFTPGPDGFVPGWLFLMFFRFFVGIGNAGIFTIDLPLVQEFMPAHKRGWVSALITTLLPAGSMLAGIIAASLSPVIGWRR